MTEPFDLRRLCDDDGMIRRGEMHHGIDYLCNGHAHIEGNHVRCTNNIHIFDETDPALSDIVTAFMERYRQDHDDNPGRWHQRQKIQNRISAGREPCPYCTCVDIPLGEPHGR